MDHLGQVSRDFGDGGAIVDPVLALKDILIYRTDLTESDLDLSSFTNVINSYATTPIECGLYLQEESVIDVINYIMRSLVGAWTFTASGKLLIALFTRGVSTGEITENDIVAGTFIRENTVSPPWWWDMGFGRNLTVQTENDFVGSADKDRQSSTAAEYRYGGTSLFAIKQLYPDSKHIKIDSCLTNYDDTSVIRKRILDDFNNYTKPDPAVYHKPDIISFTAKRQQFKYEVAQTITINYDRFDYDDFGPKDMLIMAIEEDTTQHTTRFTCWG
jgi:hypothetical protein